MVKKYVIRLKIVYKDSCMGKKAILIEETTHYKVFYYFRAANVYNGNTFKVCEYRNYGTDTFLSIQSAEKCFEENCNVIKSLMETYKECDKVGGQIFIKECYVDVYKQVLPKDKAIRWKLFGDYLEDRK